MKTELDRLKENQSNQMELLSYLLNDESNYYRCYDVIRPDMFTGENRQMFDAFLTLISENKKPDIQTLSDYASIPVESVIKVYTYFTGSPIPIDVLLHELFDFMAKDKLIKLASYISSQVTAGTDYEQIISDVNRKTGELSLGNSTSTINMEQAVTSLMKTINDNRKSTQDFSGIPTGLKVIDYHMGGFHEGDLVVLAGETSHGKTSLALSFMYGTSITYGQPTGIISHEMSPDQIIGRLSAYAVKLSAKHLLYGKLSDEELYDFNTRIAKLIRANIFIQDFIKRDLADTLAAIRLMVMKHRVKYVVVENAGNISVKGKNEDEPRTAEISKSMKAIALELKITVILISHLNREKDGRKSQPSLNRLRHSGQLEADADVVMFVYRAELHGYDTFPDPSDEPDINCHGMAKVFYGKGRNVGLAYTYMHFNEQLTLFSDERMDTPANTPF